ncbi:MAG: acyltransferase, partial [Candidatus Hodarchaeota archaeon]
PESKFIVGKNCTIMQLTYINCANPVIIGDDSGIGGNCLLFTHSSWLSQFEGYPVKFGSIQIGKSVWLPWKVFVMPGASIGDGSVIGANSLVVGEIPPNCLAVGSPAKVIRKAPDFPKHLSRADKENVLKEIINDMIRYLEFYGFSCSQHSNVYELRELKSHRFLINQKKWRMKVSLDDELHEHAKSIPTQLDVLLSLNAIPDDLRRTLRSKNCMWIDIEKKEMSKFTNDLGEEVSRFLKRYGVRLSYAND